MANKKADEIVASLHVKSVLKSQIMRVAADCFRELNHVIDTMVNEYNAQLDGQVKVELIKPSERVLRINADEDALIMTLQTGVYQFDRDHEAWQTDYVKSNAAFGYACIVNIYNFLTDSFKYERDEDLGYLVARVFINAEGAFFVEGKRQRGMGCKDYGKKKLDAANWRKIVETALKYCIDFDMLVPPYDNVKVTDLAHMNLEIMSSKTKTGKRLGFQFNSDDVRDN